MTGIRAVLRLNNRHSPFMEDEIPRSRAPAGQWTLWAPIAVALIAGLVYRALTLAPGLADGFLLLAGVQSYFVVWCMIVGAVPVGLRWYHSDRDPYGFSVAAIIFLLIALAFGFAAVMTGPG